MGVGASVTFLPWVSQLLPPPCLRSLSSVPGTVPASGHSVLTTPREQIPLLPPLSGEARRLREVEEPLLRHTAPPAHTCWSRDPHRTAWPLPASQPTLSYALPCSDLGVCLFVRIRTGKQPLRTSVAHSAPSSVLVPAADASAEASAHQHLHLPGDVHHVECPGGSLGGCRDSDLSTEHSAPLSPLECQWQRRVATPDSAVTGAAAAWVEEGLSSRVTEETEAEGNRFLPCPHLVRGPAGTGGPVRMPAAAELVPQAQ